MSQLLFALGVILAFEGALYAFFPDAMKRMMALVVTLPSEQLRNTGLVVAAGGFLLIWLVRRAYS